jgi:hypothetical protein
MDCSQCSIRRDLQEVRATLQALHEETARIRQLLQPARCNPDDDDQEALSILLPAITGAFGSVWVTTAEILRDPGIRGLDLGSPTSLGSLLARAARDSLVVAGFAVEPGGRVHGARLWRVGRRLPETVDMRRHS